VTRSAQGDQVFFSIVAKRAPCLNVMNLEVSQAAARLAPPSVPHEDRSMEFLVQRGIESQPEASRSIRCHKISFTLVRNSCCFRCGSNPKSRSRESIKAFESSVSRFAPARKSAQIISSM
jgi:hypothetical protein